MKKKGGGGGEGGKGADKSERNKKLPIRSRDKIAKLSVRLSWKEICPQANI